MAMQTGSSVRETRLANVAAGSATNDTFYYYLPMGHWRNTGLQFEWTAGAGGGTVTVTIEGTCQPIANASTAADLTTLTYRDITNAVFGVASFTDDFMAIDNDDQMTTCSVIRVKVVTLNKDANTAWVLYARQVA